MIDLIEKNKIRLTKYVDFLIEYNNKINLIGKSTINDIWDRHITDSLQLVKNIDNYNISDIHEYYDKFTFNITGIWFTFDKCVKNVENYYTTTIKLYQTILKERGAL